MRRPGALLGVAVGLVVYVCAFFVRSPSALCVGYEFESHVEFGWTATAFIPEYRRTWSPLVSATCRAVESDGFQRSVVLIDWPANVVALVGLVIVVASILVWFRQRSAV